MECNSEIIVVSGLPRSGTSMMMKMLQAAGIPLLIDNNRSPDQDNPKGYYEYEPVKQLHKGNVLWLANAHKKAVKIVSPLLKYLPTQYQYKVILMKRNITEITDSQNKMLINRNNPPNTPDLSKHIPYIQSWLNNQPNFSFITVNYNLLLNKPNIQPLKDFLNINNNHMLKAIDTTLYRNKA